MKKSVILLLLAIVGLLAASCMKKEAPMVQVRITNETGFDVKGLKVGKKDIGNLKDRNRTGYLVYTEFHFDSGMPDESIKGRINRKSVGDYSEFYWCGTEKYYVTEGTFEMDLTLRDADGKQYLRLLAR